MNAEIHYNGFSFTERVKMCLSYVSTNFVEKNRVNKIK